MTHTELIAKLNDLRPWLEAALSAIGVENNKIELDAGEPALVVRGSSFSVAATEEGRYVVSASTVQRGIRYRRDGSGEDDTIDLTDVASEPFSAAATLAATVAKLVAEERISTAIEIKHEEMAFAALDREREEARAMQEYALQNLDWPDTPEELDQFLQKPATEG